MPEFVRVRRRDLAVGQPIPGAIYGSDHRLLLKKGAVIASEAQLERLVEEGLMLPPEEVRIVPAVAKEVTTPFALLQQTVMVWNNTMRLFWTEPQTALERTEQVILNIQKACEVSRDQAIAFLFMDQSHKYSAQHPVHCAVVLLLVASSLGVPADNIKSGIAAALTMNLGMLDVHDQLQDDGKPLNDAQKAAVKDHPRRSVEILQAAGVTDPAWLLTVYQHHEVPDGSGYPQGLQGEDVVPLAQILHVADLYMARISKRRYRAAVKPVDALRDVLQERGKTIDPTLSAHFIKTIGVYPPGTGVKLVSGETGVVYKSGADKAKPLVLVFLAPLGAPLTTPVKRDTSLDVHSIHNAVDLKTLPYRITPGMIWKS